MNDQRNDDTDRALNIEGDIQHKPGDTGDTREAWTRPRLSRLATRSTIANPTFGGDGGAAFFQLS